MTDDPRFAPTITSMSERAQAELHFHVLPGLDDGPRDLDESLALLLAAGRDGTTTVVATPHVRPDFVTDVDEVGNGVALVNAAALEAGLGVTVEAGAELDHRMVGRLGQRDLEAIAQGPPGRRWLLMEMPFEGATEDLHAAADELRDRGFGIVIAHPERSADAALDGFAGLRRELAAGAGAQVNAQSITGGHGADARVAAFRLVRDGMATVVSSDAHGPSRPPLLTEARRQLVESGVEAAVARALTSSGPRRLLARGLDHEGRPGILVA